MKLTAYGFNTLPLNWMRSYLSNRTQNSVFNGSFSTVKTVQCRVPQGSCLGPLLYSIFTNDMPLVLSKASLAMFADDSTVFMSASGVDELNVLLQNEIKPISDWVDNNNLVLNVSNVSKCIVFGSMYAGRRSSYSYPSRAAV